MDSWTLQGDSYSFLRSAPRSFSLCHRDGTPNHVEIFDIINVPTQRSAISETTCLCDIFGDDCESQSLSSSPSAVAFVSSHREVEGTAAASAPVDDLNDSSGSYHTAQGSSEGEEGFEDSKERLSSPALQNESSERKQLERKRFTSEHLQDSEDTIPNFEPKGKSPVLPVKPSTQGLNSCETTLSPGHSSPNTFSQEGRLSSLSSSPADTRLSPSSLDLKQTHLEVEPRELTPSFKDRHSSLSHQSSTPSPTRQQDLLQSRVCHLNHNSSPSSEVTHLSQDFKDPSFKSGTFLSSPLPSSVTKEIVSQSGGRLVCLELSNSSPLSDTQASSPFPELRGRVSLPDLFSRGSTPDTQDSGHALELISDPSATGREPTETSQSQDPTPSVEPVSAVSSPGPRCTPPSPVVSVATSPELVEGIISPELRSASASPGLLSPASPAKTGTRSPSPDSSSKTKINLASSEVRTPVSLLSFSLSPSPGLRDGSSPTEHRYTSPSPEIRIIGSSPEVVRKEQPTEMETSSASPIQEPHFGTFSPRSLTSSPHITGISYSVVQPEDRDSPPFPELSHLSTPEPDRTPVSPEVSRDGSIAESTHTPRNSPHLAGSPSSVPPPEATLSSHPTYQTPSPQPNHLSLSPEARYQTLSSDELQSPSSHNRSRDPSPASIYTDDNLQYTQPAPSVRVPPVAETDLFSDHLTEAQPPTLFAKDSASPSFALDQKEETVVAEFKSNSPVAGLHSPVSVTSDKSLGTPVIEQTAETANEIQDKSSMVSFTEKKQVIRSPFFQEEDTYTNPPSETKSASSSYLISPKSRSPNISPAHTATSNRPVRRRENPNPQLTSDSLTFDSRIYSPKSTCTPENSRRQLVTKVKCVNREKFTEDTSHAVNRRQTPSPPLTRFTPIHIIAPEKPYRQWQNRNRSPSQVLPSSPSGNFKQAATNRESPNVDPVHNNNQPHFVELGRQLEMEREMHLEQERGVGMERQREKEEQTHERGEGWQASHRGEQVELSFNARNRKGPVSRSAALTSRETRQGLPAPHSYSESLVATRQLQQQQGLLKRSSQQDTRGGGASRRFQPPARQNKKSAPGRVAANRPSQSSSSSMGSELDEADSEVKWFTDWASRSLSSPEVDYLDMYNSSRRSSTNVSQPSTQESPAGVNAAWLAYADFRGSAPKMELDEGPVQQPPAYISDGLDPSRRYELGSFECIDVAVERDDTRKVKRGVPKRQIQLKRKNSTEGKQEESSENSSPGLPATVESPHPESHPKGSLVRQHSTPAAIQECQSSECSPEPSQHTERRSKFQKSASMDETCSKTKIASCLIKSVLSKKMQSVDRQPDEQAVEEASPQTESTATPLKESPKSDSRNLSSSVQSDYSLSSEGLPVRSEAGTKDEAKGPKNHRGRSSNRPSSSSSSRSVTFSQTDSEEAESQSRNESSLKPEMKSELKVQFDSKHSRTGLQNSKAHKRERCDSTDAAARDTGAPSDREASCTQARMINRDQKCEHTEDHKQLLQRHTDAHKSKTQETTLSHCLSAVEKKKASLNVCLTSDAESKTEVFSPGLSAGEKDRRTETDGDEKKEDEEEDEKEGVKAPIHKVRDVRRLVKNTYNLSFKAAGVVMPLDINEGRREHFNEEKRMEVRAEEERDIMQGHQEKEHRMERKEEQKETAKESKMLTSSSPQQSKRNPPSSPQTMQIEYKAVCWKDDKSKMLCSKKDSSTPFTEVSRESQIVNANIPDYKPQATESPKICEHDVNITRETQEITTEIHKVAQTEDRSVATRADRKPPMLGSLPKLPSKEREVSTAVVLIREKPNKANISPSPDHEDIPSAIQGPAPPSLSPGPTTAGFTPAGGGGHSVSMLLKEKGYQADIGAVVGENHNAAGGKGVPPKHVNCLEIPLQTLPPSDGGVLDSHRERTFSSSSTTSGPSAATDNADILTKPGEDDSVDLRSSEKDSAKQKRNSQEQKPPLTKQRDIIGDFEAVKRLDPTFPPRSPAIRRFQPQPIEVKSLSKEPQTQETPKNSTGNHRPQSIEVKSIAKSSQKPVVPPKPNCKFKPADLAATPNEGQRVSGATSTGKPSSEEKHQTIVVSSPTIYRKISNESTSTSNHSRKLAVSAVSSLKPPPHKTTATTVTSLSNQSATSSDTDASDRGQQQQAAASPQSSKYAQKPTSLATPATGSGVTISPGVISDAKVNHIPGPALAGASQPALMDPESQMPYPRATHPHEQGMSVISSKTKQPTPVSTTQVPRYAHQLCHRSLSSERVQRTGELHFYASDDPPSYDERESFSPLVLPDLTPLRQNRYQPSSRPPPCSCTAGCPSHPGPTPPHHHRSPHNLTPPALPQSPGQALPYPMSQPPPRPHQYRGEPQPMSYRAGSPKSSPVAPNQPSSMYQSLHQSAPCPPHPSLMQACSADRPLQPSQHIDPRRPPVHKSPHQQPPGIAGAPYNDPSHSHSPGLPPMDHQYLCGSQSMGPSYGSEYGGDSSSLYSESSYGQTPRRVLLDPETGKYFYIEVPVQPLRKMLFDPETGQYVEVLIPQQAMSHSGLYPPSAAPFPPLHNPNMYAPAPQYMPCAAPPPLAHPQAQPQPPRYPEASGAAAMHPSGPGASYRNPPGQVSKPGPQNHPPLDHSYLESMYYVPTGMNSSPNPTPPDYYHKHPPNLPPTGGKRS
ncbi:uncharacterized protein FYW49_005932 [Xenentodon cancila]